MYSKIYPRIATALFLAVLAACGAHLSNKPSFNPDTLESLSLEELLSVRITGEYKGKGIYQSPLNPVTSDTVNFAVLMPLGYFPKYSASMFAAADLAAERINATGGINGKKVAIIRADINYSRQSAVQFSKQLVEDYKVVALFGPGTTEAVREVMLNVSIPKDIPLITHSASSISLTLLKPDALFWQLSANNYQQANAITDFLVHRKKSNRVVLVSGKGIYGQELSYSIRKQLPDTEFLELSYSSLINIDKIDLSKDFEQVKRFEPDAIVFSIHSDIIRQYFTRMENEWNGKLPLLVTGDVLVKAKKDQTVPFPQIAKCLNLVVTDGVPPTEFSSVLKNYYDYDVLDIEAASLYDSLILMALAREISDHFDVSLLHAMRTITTGETKINGLDLQKNRNAIHKMSSFQYEGASGRVRFNSSGSNEFARVTVEPFIETKDPKCD